MSLLFLVNNIVIEEHMLKKTIEETTSEQIK